MTCKPFESLNTSINEKNFTAFRIQNFSSKFDSSESFGFHFLFIVYFCFIFLMNITLIDSLISLVFAACDRYFALAFPFRYRNSNTIRIAKHLSVIIRILSTLIFLFTIFYVAIKDNSSTLFFLQPTTYDGNISSLKESRDINFITAFLFVLFALL